VPHWGDGKGETAGAGGRLHIKETKGNVKKETADRFGLFRKGKKKEKVEHGREEGARRYGDAPVQGQQKGRLQFCRKKKKTWGQ